MLAKRTKSHHVLRARHNLALVIEPERQWPRWASTAALILVWLCTAQPAGTATNGVTAESYAAMYSGTLIPAGRTEIDGRRMACGPAPTVLDPHYKDFGGAFPASPSFIVLNPRLFVGLSTPVKLWIFSHECAHTTDGSDEIKADCAAVRRGKREGWLMAAGLDQVCEFMKPARGDQSHFTGVERCALMRQCFAQQRPGMQNEPTRMGR